MLNNLLKLRSENDFEFHLKRSWKKRHSNRQKNSGYILASFDHFKSQILSEFNRVKYRDLEVMVYRLQLTYDEIVENLDVKYKAGSTVGYTLVPGIYEISDTNLMI